MSVLCSIQPQVNNSGATWGASIDTYPDSAWSKLLTLNVQRVFTLTQKLLPMLEKGGKRDGVARVINVGHISSVALSLSSHLTSTLCLVQPIFLGWMGQHHAAELIYRSAR